MSKSHAGAGTTSNNKQTPPANTVILKGASRADGIVPRGCRGADSNPIANFFDRSTRSRPQPKREAIR